MASSSPIFYPKMDAAPLSRRAVLSWPFIIGALVYLALLFHGGSLLRDGDTYWHIAAGRWIIEHGAIPHQDPFSHSMPAAAWTAHEWLSEAVLAFTYQWGGWAGVIALTALVFAAALAFLLRFLLRYLEPIHALAFAVLGASLTAPHLLARPHLLAMPVMIVWTASLVRASEAQRSPSLWLLPLMTLWANLHGGFTLGLALALAFAAEAVLNAPMKAEKIRLAKSWSVFVALALFSALITPHGLEGVLFTLRIMDQSYALDIISEWQSPDFHNFQPLELWLLVGLAVAFYRGLKFPFIRLVLLLGLLHLSLKHARHVELLGLLAPLFLASPFASQWYGKPSSGKANRIDRFFEALARPARKKSLAAGVLCLGLVTLAAARFDFLQPQEEITAASAIQAAKAAGLTGPVLNNYGFGGYLIFSGIAPFIDGRADMYGDDFLKAYLKALGLKSSQSLEEMLEKYAIEWTLLIPGTPAVALLDHLPEWQRFYADEVAVIHVRKTGMEEI